MEEKRRFAIEIDDKSVKIYSTAIYFYDALRAINCLTKATARNFKKEYDFVAEEAKNVTVKYVDEGREN